MSLFRKPTVNQLIEKRDIKGLWKESESNDYPTRRDAIIGLIKLNELIPNILLILTLINDPDSNIRKVPYTYSPAGEFGLYANTAAIHDTDTLIRINALEVLASIHKTLAADIIRRCSVFDPDQQLRNMAKIHYQRLASSNLETIEIPKSVNSNSPNSWYSNESLMEDFAALLKKEENFNPEYSTKNGGGLYPYGSPLMLGCRRGFTEAQSILPRNKAKASEWLAYAQNCAIEGMNSISANVPIQNLLKMGERPYYDFLICTTIMLTKLGV